MFFPVARGGSVCEVWDLFLCSQVVIEIMTATRMPGISNKRSLWDELGFTKQTFSK